MTTEIRAEDQSPMRLIEAEHDDLRRATRALLSRGPATNPHGQVDSERPFNRELWHEVTTTIGLAGFGVDEAHGGDGEDVQAVAAVAEEAGRTLAALPILSTFGLAAPLLTRAVTLAEGDVEAAEREPAASELLRAIARGGIATLAWMAQGGSWRDAPEPARAIRTPQGWKVEGSAVGVIDGAVADTHLVLAATADGPAVFAVGAAAARVTPRRGLDPTRGIADVAWESAVARPIGRPGEGRDLVDAAIDRACVLLAAEMAGAAQRCLEMTLEHTRQRTQFGRPIASFQAIKHRCADIHLAVESARVGARYAAWAANAAEHEVPRVAPAVKAQVAETAFLAASENVQLHGAIGFTWEHEAHLYLKRAQSTRALFGGTTENRMRVADLLGI